MTLILLTNDDGIHAPGIHAMRRELRSLGDVETVAPHVEQSGSAHALTIDQPLRLHPVMVHGQTVGYSVTGSPADCVKVGVAQHLSRPPDLLVSGINHGQNTGVNVLYSGTVAAALEGAMLGVPSIAVSLARADGRPDFATAARIALRLISAILNCDFPADIAWNVNIPGLPQDAIRGVRLTRQSVQAYVDGYERRIDPRGGEYFWIDGQIDPGAEPAGTDLAALRDGCISVTPLSYDLTARGNWDAVRQGIEIAMAE